MFKSYLNESIYGLKLDDFISSIDQTDRKTIRFIEFVELDANNVPIADYKGRMTPVVLIRLYRQTRNKKQYEVTKFKYDRQLYTLCVTVKGLDINGEDPLNIKSMFTSQDIGDSANTFVNWIKKILN